MSAPIKPAANPRHANGSHAGDDQTAALDVLHELNTVSSIASVESRLDSLEQDITMMSAAREDDAGRLSGELAIMKARVEDALAAVSATVQELRKAGARVEETPSFDAVAPPPGVDPAELAKAVGDVKRDAAFQVRQARTEIEAALQTLRAEFQSSFTGLLSGFEQSLQSVREQGQEEIARVKDRNDSEVESIRAEVRDELLAARRDLSSGEESISSALRAVATRVERLQGQLAEADARYQTGRASFNATVQSINSRIDSVEEKLADGMARLAEGILRIAENVGSATTLARRVKVLEARMAAERSVGTGAA